MNTSVRQILAIAVFLMPFGWLQAQENKHAQAMRTAFVETINGNYPKTIQAKLASAAKDGFNVYWEPLDGGGLVPKEKIHVVTLSKNRASIGPLYLDGHHFIFNDVPDDPSIPLSAILDAFDNNARFSTTYYSSVADNKQSSFPGIALSFGEEAKVLPIKLEPNMNVRVIGFKDGDGFRSTYLLCWVAKENENATGKYKVSGFVYEAHTPDIASAQMVRPIGSEDEYLDRMNTVRTVAYNLVHDILNSNPERAAALNTDTLVERFSYSYQKMVDKLYGKLETTRPTTSFDALKAKVLLMQSMCRTATPTEKEAICHMLVKEMNDYPFMFSRKQADALRPLIDVFVANVPQEQWKQVASARSVLDNRQNRTENSDQLNEKDWEYLNRNFWNLSHYNHGYNGRFTAEGEHYTGDRHAGYLEVRGDATKDFQAQNTLINLPLGRYRISAVVRASKADKSSVCVFCQVGDKLYKKEIPAEGNEGGNVWFSAFCRYEQDSAAKKNVCGLDITKSTANDGKGYGWNRIYIDDIVVSNGTLTYGVSTRPEITNYLQIDSSWFSACDFSIERIGD